MRCPLWLHKFWNARSLFCKIFCLTLLLLGSFAAFGEWTEHWVGKVIYGDEQGLSNTQEVLVWALCTLIVTVAECLVITRIFMEIIKSIVLSMRRFSAGELSVRMPDYISGRGDEWGFLARAFNEMAAQREQEVMREKTLLAAVSHELRSPLTRLSVATELVHREYPAINLSRLIIETERMNALISSILDYSRFDMIQPAFAWMNLSELIRELAEDLEFEGSMKECSTVMDMPENLSVCACRTMLRHALENVLRNALKYSPVHGRIMVAVKVLHEFFYITVQDQGPGVPESMLPDLFRPFFRGDASRSSDSGGTGMGLAIAERIIHAHHGRIWAENSHSEGLSVIMELPVDAVDFPQLKESSYEKN